MKGLAPTITLEGKWRRVETKNHRARRRLRWMRSLRVAAAVLLLAGVGYLSYGGFRSDERIVGIDEALVKDGASAPRGFELGAYLGTAWRELLLEGLWAGNVETLPEHPAGLPPEFWREPQNPFSVPEDVELPWAEWKPLWVFGNELSADEVLAAFRSHGETRPFIVFEPPQELLDLVGGATGEGGTAVTPSDEGTAGMAPILMLMSPGSWEVVDVGLRATFTDTSAPSPIRQTYEHLARATMIQLKSFVGHAIPNPDSEDDRETATLGHEGVVVFSGGWGEAVGEFQAPSSTEEALDGYSLAVGPREYLFLLDPLGRKVQIVSPEGEPAAEIALRAQSPEDVAVSTDATVFVNDRRGTGEVQAYRIDSGFARSVPAIGGGLEVVGLTGVSSYYPSGVIAEVSGAGEDTFYADVYRLEIRPLKAVPETSSPSDKGAEPPVDRSADLQSPLGSTGSRLDLQPLGQAWWGRVRPGTDGPYLDVSGPRGPFKAKLSPAGGAGLEKVDVLSLVEPLSGDPRDCRVMVSGVVREPEGSRRRAVWLFDTRGELLEHFLLPGSAVTDTTRLVAAAGSFEGFLYVLELRADGVRVVRYGVE